MTDNTSLNRFDADARIGKKPQLMLGGRTYTGRILSVLEWSAFYDRLLAAEERERKEFDELRAVEPATVMAHRALCAEYLRVVFPQPWPRRLWRDPIVQLERDAGPDILIEAFAHFFIHQCYAMGVARRTPTVAATKTDGTDSPSSIAAAPSGAGVTN